MLVIASDPHLHTGGQFARPLENGLTTWAMVGLTFMEWFTLFCENLKPELEGILIAGDLFSLKNNIPVPLFNKVHDALATLVEETGVPVYIIPGNHDRFMRSVDDDTHSLYTLGRGIQGLHVITDPNQLYQTKHYSIFGVPAGVPIPSELTSENMSTKGRDIRVMMIHENIVGAHFPSGSTVEEQKGIDRESVLECMRKRHIDYTICGDIHRGQLLTPKCMFDLPHDNTPTKLPRGKTIILPGSPYRQDFGDEGQRRGVLTLDRDSLTFHPYPNGPKFVTVTDENFEKVMRQPKSGAYMRFRISKPRYREQIDKLMEKDQFFRDHFVCEYTYAVEQGEFTPSDVHDYRSLIGDYVITEVDKSEEAKKHVTGLISMGLDYFDRAKEALQK